MYWQGSGVRARPTGPRREFSARIFKSPLLFGLMVVLSVVAYAVAAALLSLAFLHWAPDLWSAPDVKTAAKEAVDRAPNFDKLFSFWGTIGAGGAAAVGGAFALWRWTVDQTWRRVQYAQQLLKEFFAKENTKLALRMLDVQGGLDLPAIGGSRGRGRIEVTEDLLVHSLLTFEHQSFFDEPYFAVRMIFDEFFTDLSMFQHHVDSGLITIDDIRPYLEYWVKAMCGHGPIHSNRVASRIDSFLKAFNYDAVLRLFAAIGCSLEAIECTIDPEIRKADRDLFQFITKKAAAWKGTIQRTEKVEDRDADFLSGVAKVRLPVNQRAYALGPQIDGPYLTVIQTDYSDKGDGELPSYEVHTILWDAEQKVHLPIAELFEEASRITVTNKLFDHIEEHLTNGFEPTRENLFEAVSIVMDPNGWRRGIEYHYPPIGLGDAAEQGGAIFWSLASFKPCLSGRGKQLFA